MPTEEVPLRTEASPACLEREDHAATASDGLRYVQIGFFTFIRKGRLGSVSILLYVDDLVITGADLGEIDRVKLQLAASFDMKDLGDPYPRRHLDQPTPLCAEYALQIRDGRL